MPRFGTHISTRRGLHNAIAAAVALGCATVQLFTKNARTGPPPLADEEVTAFRRAASASTLKHLTAHDAYVINLASPNDTTYAKSVTAFADELERAEALGLDYLVTHPGSHTGSGEEAGLARHRRLRRSHCAAVRASRCACCWKRPRAREPRSATASSTSRRSFSAKCADRMDVCFDTCHVFAAGYRLASESDYATHFPAVRRHRRSVAAEAISRERQREAVRQSRGPAREHRARRVGIDAFRRLVTDPRFADLPMILETPKEDDDGNDMDAVNLAALRGFATAAVAPRRVSASAKCEEACQAHFAEPPMYGVRRSPAAPKAASNRREESHADPVPSPAACDPAGGKWRGGLRSGNPLLPCIRPRKPCPVYRVIDPRRHPVPDLPATDRPVPANRSGTRTPPVGHDARGHGAPTKQLPPEPVGFPHPHFT